MRSISSETIFFIVLIAQKYSGKVDLWGVFRQCHKPVAKLNTTIRFYLIAQHLGNGLDTMAMIKTNRLFASSILLARQGLYDVLLLIGALGFFSEYACVTFWNNTSFSFIHQAENIPSHLFQE